MKKTVKDLKEVHRVLSHPTVFSSTTDDFIKEPAGVALAILKDPSILTLMPNEDTVILFKLLNRSLMETHIACVEGKYRRKVGKASFDAIRYMFWACPDVHKFVAMIPECNVLPRRLAGGIGMVREGRITECFLKDGKYEDLIVYGATRDILKGE